MARKATSTLPEEAFEAAAESRGPARLFDESPLNARMLDLDDEGESPFLRGQKRVPVRRGALPRKAIGRIKLLLIVLLVVGRLGWSAPRCTAMARNRGASASTPATTSRCWATVTSRVGKRLR